jgi:hypothetical protein
MNTAQQDASPWAQRRASQEPGIRNQQDLTCS